MKTYQAKPGEVTREWYVIDLADVSLGRAATRIANVLRGKHKPEFTPHVDAGDFVVVINAEKVKLTGNKLKDKVYHRHTGWIGNLRSQTAEELLATKPDAIIRTAVRGMLPKTILGRQLLKKLKVYTGTEHPHAAQQPQPLSL
ncbi:MAG: 50S ribosomal protein L13 [Myxococcales bacterium]|nr:50S ribosomal protein L13 [Myxococcales bacterium]